MKTQKISLLYCLKQDNIVEPNNAKADGDDSTPEEIVKELVSVKTAVLREILIDLNKISQKAFSPEVNLALYDDEPMKIAMERRNTGKQINTFVSMNFDFSKMTEEGLNILGTEKLTPFDKIVLDAVNSLYIEGHNEYITTQMVFHVITGDSERRITPNYAEEINNSFIKLLFTRIVIKADEEAIMYPALKDFSYHDNDPDRLSEVPGIGAKRIEKIKKSWAEQREIKNIMVFLQSHDVSTSLAAKIFKQYGKESITAVTENPYRLADEICANRKSSQANVRSDEDGSENDTPTFRNETAGRISAQ